MKNVFAGITGFSIAVSSLVIAIVICVVGYRIISGDNAATSTSQNSNDTGEIKKADPGVAKKDPAVERKRTTTTLVMVDEDDFRMARKMHDENVDDSDDEPTKDKPPGPKKLKSFKDLPDEEKNRIWWEIASIATFHQGESVTYTLKITQAMRIAKVYGTSALDVFQLFREGANASWRTAYAPEEEDDQEEE